MTDLQTLITKMRSAYDLFAAELNGHMETFRSVREAVLAAGESEVQGAFEAQARSLEQKFHVIKGGAGFLQLKDLAELASAGERWFKGGKLPECDIAKLRSDYVDLIDRVEAEKKELDRLLAETTA